MFFGYSWVSTKKFHCSRGTSYWRLVSLTPLHQDTVDETLSALFSQIGSCSFLDFSKHQNILCLISNCSFDKLYYNLYIKQAQVLRLLAHSTSCFRKPLIAKKKFLNIFSLQQTKMKRERVKQKNQISDEFVSSVCWEK